MWLSLTTGDSGEWDKEGGYIRKKLRWRGGRAGATGRVPPPIVCTRSRQASGNKTMRGILPNTGRPSTSGLMWEHW